MSKKVKLKLADLEVQSFATSLNSETKRQIKGLYNPWSDFGGQHCTHYPHCGSEYKCTVGCPE